MTGTSTDGYRSSCTSSRPPRPAGRSAKPAPSPRALDVPGVRHHRLLSLFAGTSRSPSTSPSPTRAATVPPRASTPGSWSGSGRAAPQPPDGGGGPRRRSRSSTWSPPCSARARPLAYYATGHLRARRQPGAGGAVAGPACGAPTWWRPKATRCSSSAGSCSRVPEDRSLLAPNGRDPDEFHPPERRDPDRRAGECRSRRPVLAFVGALTAGEAARPLRRGGGGVAPAGCGRARRRVRRRTAGRRRWRARPPRPAWTCSGRAPTWRTSCGAPTCSCSRASPPARACRGSSSKRGMSGLPVVATAVPGVRTHRGGRRRGVRGRRRRPRRHGRCHGAPRARRSGAAPAHGRGGAGARCVERFSLEAVAACWLSFLEPLVERAASGSGAGEVGQVARRGPGA